MAPEAGEKINYVGVTDPDLLDLQSVPPLTKFRDTSDEEWKATLRMGPRQS